MPNPLAVNPEWRRDCLKWRGAILRGQESHWCYEWDGLPIDETCSEWPCNCSWASKKLKKENNLQYARFDGQRIMHRRAQRAEGKVDKLNHALATIYRHPFKWFFYRITGVIIRSNSWERLIAGRK